MRTIQNVSPGDWQTAVATIPALSDKPLICVGVPSDVKGPAGFKAVATCGEAGAPDEDESIANAVLIAASKKLLACCQAELKDWNTRTGLLPSEQARRDALVAAIRAAEEIPSPLNIES